MTKRHIANRFSSRVRTLYFDNSVLEPIAAAQAGGRLKKLLKEHRAIAFGSIQNLIEFFRIDDDELRAMRVRTLLQVTRQRETEPVLYEDIQALIGQLRTRHPQWLNERPRLEKIRKELADAKIVWERIKADPEHRPPGFVRNRRWLTRLVGESMLRDRRRGRNPDPGSAIASAFNDRDLDRGLRPQFESLPSAEGHWREHTGLAYWVAIEVGDEMGTNLKDWLEPYLLFDRIDRLSWFRFWLVELDANAVPRMRAEGLTDYFQERIDSGNAGDIEHAGYAVGRDYLLTADKEFQRILAAVRRQPETMLAEPVLINRGSSDIVGDIASAVGWSPA